MPNVFRANKILAKKEICSSWMWRQPIAALAGFQGLAVELPGHGGSTVPWTSVPDAAAAVAKIIRSRVPGGKAHVVGLSLGGVVALQLLAEHPDTVDRMLVSGTSATGLPRAGFLAGLTALTLPLGKFGPLVRLSARMLAIPKEDYQRLMADVRRLEAEPLRRMILDVANFRPPAVLGGRPHQVLVVAGSKEHLTATVNAPSAALLPQWPSRETAFHLATTHQNHPSANQLGAGRAPANSVCPCQVFRRDKPITTCGGRIITADLCRVPTIGFGV